MTPPVRFIRAQGRTTQASLNFLSLASPLSGKNTLCTLFPEPESCLYFLLIFFRNFYPTHKHSVNFGSFSGGGFGSSKVSHGRCYPVHIYFPSSGATTTSITTFCCYSFRSFHIELRILLDLPHSYSLFDRGRNTNIFDHVHSTRSLRQRHS